MQSHHQIILIGCAREKEFVVSLNKPTNLMRPCLHLTKRVRTRLFFVSGYHFVQHAQELGFKTGFDAKHRNITSENFSLKSVCSHSSIFFFSQLPLISFQHTNISFRARLIFSALDCSAFRFLCLISFSNPKRSINYL